MTNVTTKPDSSQLEAETAPQLFDNWLDPIETEVRSWARCLVTTGDCWAGRSNP